MTKKKKLLILGSLMFAIVFVFTYTVSYSKYVFNSIWNYYLTSNGFYFESDYLGVSAVDNVNMYWDGGATSFTIRNNLNQSLITAYDITYQVTCEITGEAKDYATCNLNGTSSSTYTGTLSSYRACINNTGDGVNVSSFNKTNCLLSGYNWSVEESLANIYFSIDLTDQAYELNDVNVSIVVQSLSPYTKTLRGNFMLYKADSITNSIYLDYNEYSNYSKVIVTNSNTVNKCLQLSFDTNKYHIDLDDASYLSSTVDLDGYVNKIVFSLNGKRSVAYQFYKTNLNGSYILNDFALEEVNGCS